MKNGNITDELSKQLIYGLEKFSEPINIIIDRVKV